MIMKIKMLHVAAGPDGVMLPDQEYEVASDMGAALVAGEHAESLEVVIKNADNPTASKRRTANRNG